jgi:hypothetical protein
MKEKFTRRRFLQASALVPASFGLSGGIGHASAPTAEIRSIVPPRLAEAYLGERILCHRPMRHGAPNMSIQQDGTRTIAHNYGHGGSGWTLAPGSASYVIGLVEDALQGRADSRTEPVVVLGAGVIGLFTAYELVQRGFTDVTVIADRFETLTSHNAGGLLAPVSMDNEPEMQVVIDQIGVNAYRFYEKVARGELAEFKGGAVIVPTYFEQRSDSGLEPYVGIVMQPAKDVVLDFGNGTQRPMVAYDDGIFIDTAVMMKALSDVLQDSVRFEKRKVGSFDELSANLIFDCTGLGAGALNDDPAMVSVQGHLIMLKDQTPQDLQYMILVYFGEDKTDSGQKVKRSLYVFPKQMPNTAENDIGVVGGTFIEGATADTPNVAEFDILIAGAKRFYGL